MADYNVKIIFTAEDKASPTIGHLHQTMQDAKAGMSTIGQHLVGGFAGLAAFGLKTLSVGAGILATGMGLAIREASQSEAIMSKLQAVLAATGGKAGWTAEMANSLAQSLSTVTGVEDEAILNSQAILLTFSKIGSDIFPRVTELALDMSKVFGTDLTSASVMLGKALQDPIEGVGALRRVGVSLSESQEKQIQKFVALGDIASAQAVILDELQNEVGGAARAYGETFAGTLDKIKVQLGDAAEVIGAKFLPVLQSLLQQYIIPNIPTLVNFGVALADKIIAGIPKVIQFVQNLSQIITNISLSFQQLATFLTEHNEIIVGIFAALASAIGAYIYTVIIPAIMAMVTAFAPAILVMLAIGAVATALYAAWKYNFGGIRDTINQWVKQIQPIFENIRDWLAIHIPIAIAQLQQGWQMIWSSMQAVFAAIWPIITSIWQAWKAAFSGDWYGFGVAIRKAWDETWALIRQILSQSATAIQDAIKDLIIRIVNKFHEIDWLELGKSIIQGIATGIRTGVGWLIDAIQAVLKAMMDAALGFLKASSPSRLTDELIGQNIMAGISQGIIRTTPQSVQVMQRATEEILRPAQTTIQNFYQLNVTSMRSTERIAEDFWLMRGWHD